jgi:RNA polymerase sigma-70 factor, ECF subfamily
VRALVSDWTVRYVREDRGGRSFMPRVVAELEATIQASLNEGRTHEAATTAVRGYGPAVLGFLVSALRDRDAGKEVFAQACENLWRNLAGFRRECAFGTWFYVLAWNAAKNHLNESYRRRIRRLHTSEISQLAAQIRSTGVSDLRGTAARLRESLTPEERTLLILRIDRELPWRDVARVMDVDEPSLRKRFERLRRKLQQRAEHERMIKA